MGLEFTLTLLTGILVAGIGVLLAIALRRLPEEPRNLRLRTFSLVWVLVLGLVVLGQHFFR
jgi:hypothetical protein